jgi:RpiB/LacA/LacB family sugar-phosphate isomerase
MRFSVGSDHAGVSLRRAVVAHLRQRGHEVEDIGPIEGERVDYPDPAAAVARSVVASTVSLTERPDVLGVLICGTGIGVSIAANKIAGVRAALVHDPVTAALAAEHNAANVLCLGARLLAEPYALSLIDTWLAAAFEPRHAQRVAKIAALEGQR